MSLHRRLRPTRVGLESKNIGFGPGESDAAIGMESVLAIGAGMAIGTESKSTLAIGASSAQRSARKPVSASNITHYHNPGLVPWRRH